MQVGPERVAQLINVLAGLKADANPSLILGATDQSPYAMTQLYQFLASGGEIQPLHAVRGVLDPQNKLLKRYDNTPAPAQPGDSVAANVISVALQEVVNSGTARQLIIDGLGRLSLPAKPEPPTMDVTAGTRATPGTTWLSFGSATTKTSKLAYTAPPVPCAFGRASSRSYQAPDYKSTAKDWIGSQSSLWALAPQTQTAQAHAAFRL